VAHKVAPFRGARPNYGREFKYIWDRPRFTHGREAAHVDLGENVDLFYHL